ncbi:MAG: hypothetical protein RL291_91 [Pseudomonadota bacterium]
MNRIMRPEHFPPKWTPVRRKKMRKNKKLERAALVIAALTGCLMLIIGLRFLISPRSASHFFGIGSAPAAESLKWVIGLRDLWVGALALAFALLREWRALALWFGFGALVCFGDAIIVARALGPTSALAFHTTAGIICLALAAIFARRARDPAAPPPQG